MDADDLDRAVRLAAFDFLHRASAVHGSTLPFRVLRRGFEFEGERVPLLGLQGIFKPRVLPRLPLTIMTAPAAADRSRPYDDGVAEDGGILYCYRGTNPRHPDNEGLRAAMRERAPLAYLVGQRRGWYSALWPAYVVGDDPASLRFRIAVDDASASLAATAAGETASARRAYATVLAKRRLHQDRFREDVLLAYADACAMCRFRHRALLDAAHIVPDSDPRGDPVVPNGLALCRFHHGAFDRDLIGVHPEMRIEVRPAILDEEDGPMLRHGLQELHGVRLRLPRRAELRPDPERVRTRYERFRSAG